MTTESIRLGMVGGGQGGLIGAVHRIAARMDGHFNLVAGALSSDPGRALASALELNIEPERSYASFEDMAAAESRRDDGIEVVAIVTPNHLHFAAAKAFLEAGIHVICDKPLTSTLEDAETLTALVHKSDKLFVLTHNYTGYPMIRHAREMVRNGELGEIRLVHASYLQDWLARPLEQSGQKQAEWRTDPSRSGPGGAIGDIGTHAYNLLSFVSGLELKSLTADLDSFVDGRRLDDNAHIMMRFEGGAKGAVQVSQVAAGHENDLTLRVYGTEGGLEWSQTDPNYLWFTPLEGQRRRVARGGPGAGDAAAHATRVPPGHPEGYLEGFANIYADAAAAIRSMREGAKPPERDLLLPTVEDGLAGMRFISACVRSSANGGIWIEI